MNGLRHLVWGKTMSERSIFLTVLEMDDPASRSAYLDEVCAGAPEVRRRIEALMRSHQAAGAFLEVPVLEQDPAYLAAYQIDTLSPDPITARGTDIDLGVLSPSDQPGVLGTLGAYEVQQVVGRGGMGVVLKAFHPALARFVAIKVLAPQLAANVAAHLRFAREGKAAAAVKHENVVAIHAVEEARGMPYLVMEYVAGPSLQEKIDRTGPLAPAEVLRIGMQIARGLAAAHAQGLVHRDIKPANILLEAGTERAKITDFSLARAVDDASVTQNGVVAGTPAYMSPEQAGGEAIDHRTDLFSLGSVLYALCAGHPPFGGGTNMAVLRRVVEAPPRPIREISPNVPEWLARTIEKLHAKHPKDRYQTAAEVADLFCARLAGLQGLPPAYSPESLKRKAKRPRGRWVAVGFMLLVMATAALMVTVLRIRTPDGTLVVQIDDPGVTVTVELDGKEIAIHGAGAHEIRLRPGAHQIRAAKDGMTVQDEIVTISRGGKSIVSIRAEGENKDGDLPAKASALQERLRLDGHRGGVMQAVFSRDGKRIVSASGWPNGDGTIRLWNLEGKEIARLRHPDGPEDSKGHTPRERPGEVYALAFAPDARAILSGGAGGNVYLWDTKTGKEIRRFQGHTMSIYTVAFTPDGKQAISAGADGTVRVWDVETGRQIRVMEHADCIRSVAVSPDGRTLLTGCRDKTMRLWDLATGKERRCFSDFPAWVECVAFSPDGRQALSGGGDMRLWDLATGKELRRFGKMEMAVISMAFSPDGEKIISGGYDKTVRLWDVASGRQVAASNSHRNWIWSVAFSPDGRSALSAGGGINYQPGTDFAVRIWSMEK
jgi:DNA-binding beta-propeller fold protein YncE